RFGAAYVATAIANLDAFDVPRLRKAEVSWLSGQLAFLPHRSNKIEVPFFVNERGISLAGRSNKWIYEAISVGSPPQLVANLLASVRFFFPDNRRHTRRVPPRR